MLIIPMVSYNQVDSLEYFSSIMKNKSVKNVCSGERLKAFNYLVNTIKIGETNEKFVEEKFGKHYYYPDNKNNSAEYLYPIDGDCTGDCKKIEDIVGYTLLFAVINIKNGVIASTGFRQ
jgi:hypothetical protein